MEFQVGQFDYRTKPQLSNNESLFQGLLVGSLLILGVQMFQILQAYLKYSDKPPVKAKDRTTLCNPTPKALYAHQLDKVIEEKSTSNTPLKSNNDTTQFSIKNMHADSSSIFQPEDIGFIRPIDQSPTQQQYILSKQQPQQLEHNAIRTDQPKKVQSRHNEHKKEEVKEKPTVKHAEKPIVMTAAMKIRDSKKREIEEIYRTRHELPIEIEQKDKKAILRRFVRENGQNVFIVDREVMGVKPKEIFDIITNAPVTQTKWNPRCKRCDKLGYEDGFSVEATQIIPPTRLMSGRFFVDIKYPFELENGRYMYLCSSDGHEKYVEQYQTNFRKELDGFSMAYCQVSGHVYDPIFDSNQNVIGTKIFFVNETNFGGNVPQWMINKFAPPGIMEAYDHIIKCAQDIQQNKIKF